MVKKRPSRSESGTDLLPLVAAGAAVAGLYWYFSKGKGEEGEPSTAIPKSPGDAFGATLRYQHSGVGGRFWLGVGLSDTRDGPESVVNWYGSWVDLPYDVGWQVHELEISGVFPDLPLHYLYGVPLHGVSVCKVVSDQAPLFASGQTIKHSWQPAVFKNMK